MMIKEKVHLVRLTQGLFTEVDEHNLYWITKHKWYAKRTTSKKSEYGTYYAARSKRVNGVSVTIYLHREIKQCPDDMEVDHINQDSLCNLSSNLRVCTRKENNENRYKT